MYAVHRVPILPQFVLNVYTYIYISATICLDFVKLPSTAFPISSRRQTRTRAVRMLSYEFDIICRSHRRSYRYTKSLNRGKSRNVAAARKTFCFSHGRHFTGVDWGSRIETRRESLVLRARIGGLLVWYERGLVSLPHPPSLKSGSRGIYSN